MCLKKCPENFPYRAENGSCFASKQEAEENSFETMDLNFNYDNYLKGAYSTAPYAVDGQCPEDKPLLYSKRCYPCDAPEDLSVSETECAKCPNRVYKYYPDWEIEYCELSLLKDKPLRRWDGANFRCDEPVPVGLEWNRRLCRRFCPTQRKLLGSECVLIDQNDD